MKRTLFILFIITLLGSCSSEFDDVAYTIANKSSQTVSFSFNGISKSLNKNETVKYSINSEKGRFTPKNIDFTGHKRSVKLETSNMGTAGIIYTFTDAVCYTLEVINTLSIPVTIKADDFITASIDTGTDAYDDEEFTLTIKENNKETASIYTSTPDFKIVSNKISDDYDEYPYPAVIDWNFIGEITEEDDTTIVINTIYVIIR